MGGGTRAQIFVLPVLSCARIRLLQNHPAPAARGEGLSGAGGRAQGRCCRPRSGGVAAVPSPRIPQRLSEEADGLV